MKNKLKGYYESIVEYYQANKDFIKNAIIFGLLSGLACTAIEIACLKEQNKSVNDAFDEMAMIAFNEMVKNLQNN